VPLLALASLALPAAARPHRRLAAAAALLVLLQVVLGVFTLRLQLAVPLVTVAHQLTAALLVALLTALIGRSCAPLSSPSAPVLP
jgi:cytochrome c oxidase assembly protein subunit 15